VYLPISAIDNVSDDRWKNLFIYSARKKFAWFFTV